jgi:hypothetical protein
MCGILQKSIMFLGLDFIPLDQSANMFVNVLRRRVETRDKTETRTRMDKPLVTMDLGHWVLASGAHPFSFC